MKIENSVIIITGASQGIGLATAKHLAELGAKVVLAARSKDLLDEAQTSIPGSMIVVTDMRKPEDIKQLVAKTVETFGRVDILINNAGQGMYQLLEKTNIDEYRQLMELNVFAPLAAMQEVIPIMRKQGGGMIVNISSMLSKMSIPMLGAYASTKYALNCLTYTAKKELEKDHIIVSTVLPKMTATTFSKNSLGAHPDWSGRPAGNMPEVDTPEKVAKVIEEIIVSEEEERML